jgi:hypothetical protein
VVKVSAVRLDRVVAVIATPLDGKPQLGSGYLVTENLVLTAAHCTFDKRSWNGKQGRWDPAAKLQVVRASDGAMVDARVGDVVVDELLDVAVIPFTTAPWESGLAPPVFARIDRAEAGVLSNCEGIGFPQFQRDEAGHRDTAEFHGVIYQTDEAQSGRLLMREPRILPGRKPALRGLRSTDRDDADVSPWGGLSGAVAFYHGQAIGVVVEHHPRQGDSAIRMIGFDRVAESLGLRRILGLPEAEALPLVTAEPVVPLAELVDLWEGHDLPAVAELDPYRLGATVSDFGDHTSYGEHDPYVPRTSHNVDSRLRETLQPGQLVLLVGPSKAGKTRTAFEAIKDRWLQARLLAPKGSALPALVTHPRIALTSDVLVLWLDDLQRFLTTAHPLTPALLARLIARPGPVVVIATLRTEERARLRNVAGELARDTRLLLEQAEDTTIELAATIEDPAEQAAALVAYPDADLSSAGLAEQLAGAPTLLQQYRDARHHDLMVHSVLQTAIDWARVGMARPASAEELIGLALDLLFEDHPELEPTPQQMLDAIGVARTPPPGAGRVAGLQTVPLPDRSRGYRPFDYLVAADDGQVGTPRLIPTSVWTNTLKLANPDEAFEISVSANQRSNTPAALMASRQGAAAGHAWAMVTLGLLLSAVQEPPDLDQARYWYEQAAAAGHTDAMILLGDFLARELDPPDLDQARHWYEQAAAAGHTDAMILLGDFLARELDPPDLDQARYWYEQAAAAGHTDAMVGLGWLFADRLNPPELDQARYW